MNIAPVVTIKAMERKFRFSMAPVAIKNPKRFYDKYLVCFVWYGVHNK